MTKYNFSKFLEDKFNIILTKSQEKSVLTTKGPVALIAVPGAGKTLTLISRTANLILNHKVNPKKILALTFSKASALDMENRFNEKFANIIKEKIKFSTIHSFAFLVLKQYSFALNKNYKLIENNNDTINKLNILKNLYLKYNKTIINDDKLEELSGTISYIKNSMIPFNKLKELNKEFFVPKFIDIYKEYEKIKRNNNFIDFDDMLTLSYFILKKNPSMLQKYRNMYDYIEVDECQDTSKIQHEIIKLLSYPKFNLFLVGDDDQSIYSWRGAFPQELLNFKNAYKNSKVLFMEENFRSTKTIVELSNKFIKTNKNRYTKNIYTKNEIGSSIKIKTFNNEFEQIKFLINELKNESNLKETAILFRNNISAVQLIDKLSKENISFYIKDLIPQFFNHWIIKDIIYFFKLSQNQLDLDAFENIYFKIKSYISKKDLQNLKHSQINTNYKSVFKILSTNNNYNSSQKKKLEGFEVKFQLLSEIKPYKAIEYIENALNYKEYLKDFCKKFNYSIDTINYILSTLKIISLNLETFDEFIQKLYSLQEIIKQSKLNKYKNRVTLSTLHSSKGLEFNNVYIIDLIDEIFPCPSSVCKANNGDYCDLEEERRLMYVGMTRAKKNLYITYPKNRNNSKTTPSIFIKEIEEIITSINNNKNKLINSKDKLPINFKKDTLINHKKFGKGIILNIQNDKIKINFNNNIKILSISTCIKNKLIQKIKKVI